MKLDRSTCDWLDAQAGSTILSVLECGSPGGGESVWAAARIHLNRRGTVLAVRAMVTDRGRPYATLQRLLAAWVVEAERPAVQRACRGLRRLCLLVPELGEADGHLEPTGIQADLTTLTHRLAAHGPVWLLIDGLPWVDADSLAMLVAVAAGAASLPVGVCGTAEAGAALPAGVPVRAVAVSGIQADPASPVVQARVRERLSALGAEDRRVLEILSVARGPVEQDHLAAALPGVALDDRLDVLESAGWVRSAASGVSVQLEVRAPLLGTAVQLQLTPRRRQILHAAWLAAPLDAAACLRHTLGAGTRADAGAVVRVHEAGTAALRAGRAGEALPLLELAGDLARRRGEAGAGLLEDLGTARRAALDMAGCREAWEEALQADPTPAGIARLRRALAMLEWDLGDPDAALSQIQAGWRTLQGRSGPEVEALARTELIFLDRRLRYDELALAARRLLSVATSPEATSEALQVLSSVQSRRGEPGAADSLKRAVEAAREGQDARVLARARHCRNMYLAGTGRPREALAFVEGEGDRSFYANFAVAISASLLASIERLEAARDAFSGTIGDAFMVTLIFGGLRGEVDPGEIPADAVDERSRAIRAHLKAQIWALKGRPEAVVATFQEAGMAEPGQLRGPLYLYSAHALGMAFFRTGQRERAGVFADWLAARPEPFAQECGAWIRGALAGDGAALAEVADRLSARGLARMAAGCRLDAAGSASPPPDPEDQLRRAWDAVVHLGCDPELARLRQAFVALGRRPPATPRRGVIAGPLSAREQEVAVLIAEGLSNKEVAGRLYVSPATISTHVKRIYKRLGVHSRAELTRWVLQGSG